MSSVKVTADKFKSAIIGTGGVYSDVAKKLGCHRSAITLFLQKNPKLLEAVREERARLIDVAENVYKEALSLTTNDAKLDERTRNNRMKLKLKAAEKVVTTLGKDRGWIPREQRELSGDVSHNMGPIKINVIMPKNVKEKKGAKSKKPKKEKKESPKKS